MSLTISEINTDFLEGSNNPICIVNIKKEYTLEFKNDAFLANLGFTNNELQYKFANRLGALLNSSSMNAINKSIIQNKELPLVLEHTIKTANGSKWMRSEYSYFGDNKDYLFMVSSDIDFYKNIELNYQHLSDQSKYVYNETNIDIFEYNISDQSALFVHAQICFKKSNQRIPNFIDFIIDNDIVDEEYVENFKDCFAKIKNGEPSAICELKVKNINGVYNWISISLSTTVLNRKKTILGIVKDITKEKEAVLNYLNEIQFYQAMLSGQAAYGHIDVSEDRILKVGGMWNLYNEIKDKVTFSSLIVEFINKVVHPEDRELYLEIIDQKNMIASLENGIDQLGCEFRRIVENNKMAWMEISVHLFRNALNGHVMALFYLKSINNKKKAELSVSEKDEDSVTNFFGKRNAEIKIVEYLQNMNKDDLGAFIIFNIRNYDALMRRLTKEVSQDTLLQFTKILTTVFRKNDIITKYNNDNYIVCLKGIQSQLTVETRLKEVYRQLEETNLSGLECYAGITLVKEHDTYQHIYSLASKALDTLNKESNLNYNFYIRELLQQQNEDTSEHRHLLELEKILNSSNKIDSYDNDFDSFLSKYGEIAYLVDPQNYNLICGNNAFYDRIGKVRKDCLGKKCYELMHLRNSPCPFCSKANWTTDKFYAWRNYNEALEQEFLIKNKLVTWDDEDTLLAIAVDLSNDKSIVDSMDNSITENNYILSGVEHMQEASSIEDVMNVSLETIGNFFRARNVQFWKLENNEYNYRISWNAKRNEKENAVFKEADYPAVKKWLSKRQWKHSFMIENKEVMINHSYDLYLAMQERKVQNQLWFVLRDKNIEYGVVLIENIMMNYHNVSFIKTFSEFMCNEFRKNAMVESILYSSRYDKLTNLYNRYSYDDYLHNYNSEKVHSIGVFVSNMNGLKLINSLKGTQVGDEYLKQISEILTSVFKEHPVYRINGDEFIIFLKDVSQKDMEDYFTKIKETLKDISDYSFAVGYAWDDVEKDLPSLMESAVKFMQVNKKHQYERDTQENGQVSMLAGLLKAIDDHKFEVYLQPKVNSKSKKAFGAEALIRYRHEMYGIIPPVKFIPQLEENNYVRYIDLFVLDEVCKTLERWTKEGIQCPVISLNFSRQTLMEQDIFSSIESIFSKYEVSKEFIEIEITESFADFGKGILYQVARQLHQSGYSVSLDDFGTRYTNLAILTDIPVDVLKIDKSLINSLVENKKCQIIIKNIVQMCNDLKVSVICEGVEDIEQEKILNQLGCYSIQGYLYSKPISIKDFESDFLID